MAVSQEMFELSPEECHEVCYYGWQHWNVMKELFLPVCSCLVAAIAQQDYLP